MIIVAKEFTTQQQALHFVAKVLLKQHPIKYVSVRKNEITFYTRQHWCDIVEMPLSYKVLISIPTERYFESNANISKAYHLTNQLIKHGINEFKIGAYPSGGTYITINNNTYEF